MASAANAICREPETIGPRSLFGRPHSRSYRAAVSQIVRDVKARHKLSNERLAEIIGCSEQTIANAENEVGDLTAVILLAIAYAFGEEAIEPVRQLYLCAPAEPKSILSEIDAARQALNAAERKIMERGI
jgi:DNA-binding XRE family transcriptional regulator